MILDALSELKRYIPAHPLLEKVLPFMDRKRLESLAPGRHEISDGCFASVSDYTPRAAADCRLEGHRRFIDIQIVCHGTEQIGVCHISGCRPTTVYDEGKDVQFFDGTPDFITLHPGFFALFFPHDSHMPQVAVPGSGAQVRKVVIKVPVFR